MKQLKQLFADDKPVFSLLAISLIIGLLWMVYMVIAIDPQTTQIDARFNTLLKFHGRTNWQFLYVIPALILVAGIIEFMVSTNESLSKNVKKAFLILQISLVFLTGYIFVQMTSVVGF